MANTSSFRKDPDATKDYKIDWAGSPTEGGPWLTDGDIISTSTWTAEPAGPGHLAIVSDTKTTTVTRVWLTGGTDRVRYKVTNHITTADGRAEDQTLTITIRDR